MPYIRAMLLLRPLGRAIRQTTDPTFRKVLLGSLALAALAVLAAGWLALWLLHAVLGWWPAGLLALLAAAALGFFLYVPLATGIAALFTDSVGAAVERRYYPALGAVRGAPMASQIRDGLALGARVLAAEMLALLAGFLLPGIGWALGFAISAWALGRGLFMTAAMRRLTRPEALALYAARRWAVVAVGAVLALASLVPLLNLLVPVVGLAAMVHLAQARRSG